MAATMGMMVDTGRRRLLGGLTMAGGIGYTIAGIIFHISGNFSNFVGNALSLFWTLGCICGLVGIGILGAVGRGVFGRIALAIAMLAYTIAAIDAVLFLAGAYSLENSPLFAISRLSTLVGMLLVGIAAVAVGRWRGWRKFSPFAVPLAMPLTLGVAAATGVAPIVALVGLAWAIIGYAVLSTPTAE